MEERVSRMERSVGVLESKVQRIEYLLDGNGKPGLVAELHEFLTKTKEREIQMEKNRTEAKADRAERADQSKRYVSIAVGVATLVHIVWDSVKPYIFHLVGK